MKRPEMRVVSLSYEFKDFGLFLVFMTKRHIFSCQSTFQLQNGLQEIIVKNALVYIFRFDFHRSLGILVQASFLNRGW